MVISFVDYFKRAWSLTSSLLGNNNLNMINWQYLPRWTLFLNSKIIITSFFFFFTRAIDHSFETRPGPAGRPGTRLTRGRNRAGLTKKRGKEKPGVTRRVDPVTRQDPVTNPLTFVFFFTKTTSFWFIFFKELTRPNPVTRPKPGTRALDRAGS